VGIVDRLAGLLYVTNVKRVIVGGLLAGLVAWGCGVSGPGQNDDSGVSSAGNGAGANGSGGGTSSSGSAGGPSTGAGGTYPGGGCAVPRIDPFAPRPVEIMPGSKLATIVERVPCIESTGLVALLESEDTMFYDGTSIVPGYQDSYGNGIDFPVGMRPNTIQSNLIDLAVPGGHAQLFETRGLFHFPFGNPTDVQPADVVVVNFWHAPRGEGGELLPVAWWWYEPSGWTQRIRWMFPVGTVFGELMFIVGPGDELFPFEIRTRTRAIDAWIVDAHRPFVEAEELATALEAAGSVAQSLIDHLRDDSTLQPASLGASHFSDAFPTLNGAEDVLPPIEDDSLVSTLLLETGFASAKGKAWKQNGNLTAYAPTTDASFSIVPRNYNGGLVAVTDEACTACHQDAGRPFKDYYSNVLAYGELWGEDENFTWHPFETSAFVDGTGDVVSFSVDNRQMRQDFIAGGVIEEYDPSLHPSSHYQEIDRPWRNYVHQ
jgi:hypothetical protein